jgi:hypothetical protein
MLAGIAGHQQQQQEMLAGIAGHQQRQEMLAGKNAEEKTLEVSQRVVVLHENGSLGGGLQRGDFSKLLD